MQVIQFASDQREKWNDFVLQQPSFALLQSWEWGEFKEKLGWKAIRLGVDDQGQLVAGAQLLIKPLPLRQGSIIYVPRGPLVAWHKREITLLLLEAIHQIARQHKAIFLRIEPPLEHDPVTHAGLQSYGFRASAHTNQPRCTLILNLLSTPPGDIETIFASLPKKTRYHIRSCENKGVTPRQGTETDLTTFYNLMSATGQRAAFDIRALHYYQQEFETLAPYNRLKLLLADYEEQTIGVEIPVIFGAHGAAFHGATSNTHRQLPISDFLTWEGIKWAKEQGCQTYDLWGIPDEVGELCAVDRPIPKDQQGGLWGVYYFKKGFGGKVVYYVGAYDYLYIHPIAYEGLNRVLFWLETNKLLINLADHL